MFDKFTGPKYPIVAKPTPPPEPCAEFRRELHLLGGTNRFDEPNLDLFWLGEITRVMFGQETMAYRDHVEEINDTWIVSDVNERGERVEVALAYDQREWSPEQLERYRFKVGSFRRVYHDHGRQNFGVMQWFPPEIACRGHDAVNSMFRARYGQEPLGDRPERGEYRCVMVIEAADGGYRPPTLADLDEVRQMWREREESELFSKFHPTEAPPEHVLERAIASDYSEIERTDQAKSMEFWDRMRREITVLDLERASSSGKGV